MFPVIQILDPRVNFKALKEALGVLSRRRALLLEMTRRDIVDRYAGQMLGISWAVIAPLLMLGTYLFAFAFLFRGRLGPSDGGLGYMAYVMAGLTLWMAISESLTRAATAVSGNANLVKQIVFPNEILPVKTVLGTLPALLLGIFVTGIVAAFDGRLSMFGLVVKLPVAVACGMVMLIGFALILSAFGVFVPDVREMTSFFTGIGLFFHPILYPPAATPEWLMPIFVASPFSHLIWCMREALVGVSSPHSWSWLIMPASSLLIFVVGWRVFRMMKPVFGNAL